MGGILVDGAVLSWEDSGTAAEGLAVVLLHAGVADSRMWEPLLSHLGPRLRTIRPDLRGFGESRLLDAVPYRPVDDVAAVLDALGLEQISLVGASFGGLVALELAATQPERVARLALLAPPLPDHDWSADAEAFDEREERAAASGDLDELIAINAEAWGHGSSAAVTHIEDALGRSLPDQLELDPEMIEIDPPVHERLHDLRMPALVIVGDEDLEDFPRIARRLAAELPDARLEVIRGAGHLLALERPHECARVLSPFLAQA
jgi:pimeloyl-ACP methyl ester carboxylesterase